MTYGKLLENIDVHVFTGVMLYDRVKRGALSYYAKRWLAEIDRHLAFYPEPKGGAILTVAELRLKYATESEHPKFGKGGWSDEVAQGNTERGYWEWVAAQLEEEANEVRPADHTIYVKVEGGVVQSIAVRGFGENPCFDVVVHDLDSIEAGDEAPQIIKDNLGELPDDFLFIW